MTITFLITVLIGLVVLVAVVMVALWLIGKMGLPEPLNKIVIIIVVLLALLVLLGFLFPGIIPLR